jgi:long-chain acyl-CoA synthetase
MTTSVQSPSEITTLAEILHVNVPRCGDRVALMDQNAGDVRETTYAELHRLVGGFRRWLRDMGIGRGDRVAILMGNGRPWLVAYFALLEHGAVVVPLDCDYLEDGHEHLRFALDHCEARAVITSPEEAPTVRRVSGATDAELLEHPVPLPDSEPIEPAGVEPFDTAQILYTSGTTGHRKGVMLSHRNVVANAVACCERFGVLEHDCIPALLPHHHAYPLTTTVLLPVFAGARCAVGNIRSRRVGDLIRAARPTVLAAVPRVFESMLSKIEARARREGRLKWLRRAEALSGTVKKLTGVNIGRVLFHGLHRRLFGGTQLRFCVSGGARLPRELALRYYRLGIPMIQGWGMTELSPVGLVQEFSRARSTFTRHYERQAGSIGTPLTDTEVCLRDVPEQNIVVERDGKGEMIVDGPQVMQGYLGAPEATRRRITDRGIRTGDIARRHADGTYSIVGRIKHVIVLPGGKKVFPEEDLWDALDGVDLIEEFAVRAIPDGKGGEQIGIMIKPDEELILQRDLETFGDLYAALKEEITAALAHAPAYMKKYDFCLTELRDGKFAELVKSAKKLPSPLKNEFREETAWSRCRESERALEVEVTEQSVA